MTTPNTETPRTESQLWWGFQDEVEGHLILVKRDFARKLECELNASTANLKIAMDTLKTIHELAGLNPGHSAIRAEIYDYANNAINQINSDYGPIPGRTNL